MGKSILFCCVVVIAALLGGCGGSGNGGEPSSPISQMKVGDVWEYSVSGTENDGLDDQDLTGTCIVTVSEETIRTPPPQDTRTRVVQLRLDLRRTSDGGSLQYTLADQVFITQDANGAIWIHGGMRDEDVYWVTIPTDGRYKQVASPLERGVSWDEQVELSDGTSFAQSYEVVSGAGSVLVPAGTFEAYEVQYDGNLLGMPSNGKLWWTPHYGAPVKVEIEGQTDRKKEDDEGEILVPVSLELKFELSAKSP